MLEQLGLYNKFSDELRSKIENKLAEFGTRVKVKFNIAHENPDPQKYNGTHVYPFMYTLKPVTFRVMDGKASVSVGIVDKVDEKGNAEIFRRIKVFERDKGVKTFDLTDADQRAEVAYLLLHPKTEGSLFQDSKSVPIVTIVDEVKASKESRSTRSERIKAQAAAMKMTDQEILDFAAAMLWDTTEDAEVLREKVESLAETTPKFFSDVIGSKKLEYQTVISKAITAQHITFDPMERKFTWGSNHQLIVQLGGEVDGKTHVEQFAEWLMTAGEKADEVFKKMQSLQKGNSRKKEVISEQG